MQPVPHDRRRFLRRGAAAFVAGLAGCLSGNSDGTDDAGKLVPDYGSSNEHNLEQVAVSGETVIASTTPEPEARPEEPGSAYVFERTDGAWRQTAELTRPDDAPEDEFGDPVAIDGDTAVVGAWYDDAPNGWRSGTAYVFERGENGRWNRQARLVPAVDEVEELPARHVHTAAIDGDTVVLGAPSQADDGENRAGSAFVFRRADGRWDRRAALVPDDGTRGPKYGASVAVADDTVLIGAETAVTDAGTGTGAVYPFERSNGEWIQQSPLVAGDGPAGTGFGTAVALGEQAALIAAGGDESPGGDSILAFERTESGDWRWETTLVEGNESGCAGDAIALEDDTALVGDACRSSADVFVRADGSWTRQETLTATDGAGRTFGSSVSLAGETAVVADWRQSVDGGHGAAYVYTL